MGRDGQAFLRVVYEPGASSPRIVMRRTLASLLFTNSTPGQVLLKNGFWLAAADGISRLTKFLVALYVIRTLGAVEFGKFAFAFAFVSLFSALFDFGMSS